VGYSKKFHESFQEVLSVAAGKIISNEFVETVFSLSGPTFFWGLLEKFDLCRIKLVPNKGD